MSGSIQPFVLSGRVAKRSTSSLGTVLNQTFSVASRVVPVGAAFGNVEPVRGMRAVDIAKRHFASKPQYIEIIRQKDRVSVDEVVRIFKSKDSIFDRDSFRKLAEFVEDNKASIHNTYSLLKLEMWSYAAHRIGKCTLDPDLLIKAGEINRFRVSLAESKFEKQSLESVHSSMVTDIMEFMKTIGTPKEVDTAWQRLVDPMLLSSSFVTLSAERVANKLDSGDSEPLKMFIPNLSMIAATEAHKSIQKNSGVYSAIARYAVSTKIAKNTESGTLLRDMASMLAFARKTDLGVDSRVLEAAETALSKLTMPMESISMPDLAEVLNLPQYARSAKRDFDDFCVRPTSRALIDRAEWQLQNTSETDREVTRVIDRGLTGFEVKSVGMKNLLRSALVSLYTVEAQWEYNSSEERSEALNKAEEHVAVLENRLNEKELNFLKTSLNEAKLSVESLNEAKGSAVSSASSVETV